MRRLFYPVARITLVLLVSLGIGAFAPSLLPTIPKTHAAASVSIVLTGCASAGGVCRFPGWNGTTSVPNPTITVNQGVLVSLSLTSSDGAPHQFLLDVDGDGASDVADCPTVDPCSFVFTSITSYFFAAPPPGTYTYFCFVHPSSMVGSFTVNPSSAVGGVTSPVDKAGLLTFYIGPIVAILVTMAVTFVYLRQRKPSWRTGREKSITS